jgi:AcrR family transcriptional regulator
MVRFSPDDTGKPKLRAINDAARNLLFKFGIRKLTVEDICRESGVSKMTFYRYYDSKMDIVLFILNSMMEESLDAYREIMDRDILFEHKAELMIRKKMDYAGSVSQDFIHDIMENGGPEVMALLRNKTVESVQMIMDDFSSAQEQGFIRRDLNLHFLVYFINHMNEILKDPGFSSLFEAPADMIRELINFFFYGILPERSHENTNS